MWALRLTVLEYRTLTTINKTPRAQKTWLAKSNPNKVQLYTGYWESNLSAKMHLHSQFGSLLNHCIVYNISIKLFTVSEEKKKKCNPHFVKLIGCPNKMTYELGVQTNRAARESLDSSSTRAQNIKLVNSRAGSRARIYIYIYIYIFFFLFLIVKLHKYS